MTQCNEEVNTEVSNEDIEKCIAILEQIVYKSISLFGNQLCEIKGIRYGQ